MELGIDAAPIAAKMAALQSGGVHSMQATPRHVRDRLLMQQEFRCLYATAVVEPLLYHVIAKEVRQRKQAHALMVGHPGAHQLPRRSPNFVGRAEISSFVESAWTE